MTLNRSLLSGMVLPYLHRLRTFRRGLTRSPLTARLHIVVFAGRNCPDRPIHRPPRACTHRRLNYCLNIRFRAAAPSTGQQIPAKHSAVALQPIRFARFRTNFDSEKSTSAGPGNSIST